MQLFNDTSDSYLQSRAQAVESIESTIHELGDMYKRLVSIVGMQEEITLRIDANMDATLINVESGHNELLKYFDRMSSNRWLIMKIFAVLIAFLVFFMVFIA
jgi:syntaxin 5